VNQPLSIEVRSSQNLPSGCYDEILRLCSLAFECDYAPFLEGFDKPNHVLGFLENRLVSHALWITRWLQWAGLPPLYTAYVEAVATYAEFRHRGFASAVMRELQGRILDYDLAGLSTGVPYFYERLGWQRWRGPLFVRQGEKFIATPEEEGVMVLRLPGSPEIDLDSSLSIEWRPGEAW